MKSKEYIEKWLAGTLSRDEEALFSQSQEFNNLKRMDQALKRFTPAELNWDAAFENIKSRRPRQGRVVAFGWPSLVRIAAVLIIGVSVVLYFSNRIGSPAEQVVSTGAGETLEVTLPDNSVVTLNAKSSITFSKATWNENRHVQLAGEAFFAVKRGGQFEVITNSGTVTVLGTQFTVKERTDFYEVTCYEGKVQVEASTEPVQLTAKQSYREVQKQVSQLKIEVANVPAWLNQESAFESVPFREVLDELGRQYDLKILTEEVDLNQLYTGRFPNSDLTTALKSVTMPFGLTYQIKGNEIKVVHAD